MLTNTHSANHLAAIVGLLITLSLAAVCSGEESKPPERVLRHAAFFKFKDGTGDADIAKVLSDFAALPTKIDSIKGYQAGKNISPLGLDDGYTHCFLLTVDDEAGRTKYFRHPADKEFGRFMRPLLEKVFVVDYWGKPEKAKQNRQLKHALFLKFKKSTTEEQVKNVEETIAKLPAQSETVRAFEWGRNNSPEKYSDGFTHCFMFTFDDPAGVKADAETAAHKAALEKIMAVAEKGRVFDFWTAEE